jgi:lactate permease
VDVAGGLVSLICLAIFLKIWRPTEIWNFPPEQSGDFLRPAPQPASGELEETSATSGLANQADTPAAEPPKTHSTSEVISAWVPWVLLSVCVFVWGLPGVKKFFDSWPQVTTFSMEVPSLHKKVFRDAPVVPQKGSAETALFKFNWLSATGTGILIAAVLSAFWLGVRPRLFVIIFGKTAHRMRWPLFTIAAMLAIAYTTRYSGTDATLGLAFTKTGVLYPFFAAMLGWLGVALTGSDTSSNALFGSLQKITAEGLVKKGVLSLTDQQATLLMAAANSTGGVMGKMIDAQSIVVSAAATQQPGQEGQILRFVFWHSIALAALMGGLVMLQAYVLKWMIPG